MNRAYRLVRSSVTGLWVPVAENKTSRIKASGSIGLAVVLSALVVLPALAEPVGGQVISGSAQIVQSGNSTTINQSSNNTSINWQGFNIAPNELVQFVQPSATAVAVNRILGNSGTQIFGQLKANGQVYLINPNGILFGAGSQVNVGGLLASTLDNIDASTPGLIKLSGSGTGSIVNRGSITAENRGYVALVANQVTNQGLIAASLGTVALGGGSAATLTFNNNQLVHFQIDQSTLNNLVDNQQLVKAEDGQVFMNAGARDSVLASVVNNSGIVEAKSIQNKDGKIILLGGMTAGTVNLSGKLDASSSGSADGGLIETSAAHVKVADSASINTSSTSGNTGTWLIDPQDYTVAASGGDITGAALTSALSSNNVSILSSQGSVAGSGNVNVNDAVNWSAHNLTLTAANNVNVNAAIAATGTASLSLNTATTNGSSAGVSGGAVNMGLNDSGFYGRIDYTATGPLLINGTQYTVINSLGIASSTSGADLQGIRGNLSGHYVLGSNINASGTSSWNGGAGFTPLGADLSTPFSGTFNGLGHTISGLSINRQSTSNVGLFGLVRTLGEISNIGMSVANIVGQNYVGSLIGFNYNSSGTPATYGTVRNSYSVNGSISGTDTVGGLAGLSTGTISNSYASGTVNGTSNVGGLAGYNDGAILNSHSSSAVTGNTRDVGGLVGWNQTFDNAGITSVGTGYISNSYATGNVSGKLNVGGLVGLNHSGNMVTGGYSSGNVATINNSFATGTLQGNTNVGGLVGDNSGAISGSHSNGPVNGVAGISIDSVQSYLGNIGGVQLGGLAGVSEGAINSSYSTSSVTPALGYNGYNIGGLVGAQSGAIYNSYSTGSITGYQWVGGLVGCSCDSHAVISNSYSASSVTQTGGIASGGLVGLEDGGLISNSYSVGSRLVGTTYYDQGAVTITNSNVLTRSQMLQSSNFSGFNFTATAGATGNNWVMLDVDGTLNNAGGSAGSTLPMLASEYSTSISNAHQLQLVSMSRGVNYTLANNISAIATSTSADVWNSTFIPINAFSGVFDGRGYAINDLKINLPSDFQVGLFKSTTSAATVENIILNSVDVTGRQDVAGLVGGNHGLISNAHSTGTIYATDLTYAGTGGLVGYAYTTSLIKDSSSSGNVSSVGFSLGGLLGGQENNAIVRNSFSDATVSSAHAWGEIGGLVGTNGSGATIQGSYATGSVNGTILVGGLVGKNSGGSINTSYASGVVAGQARVGGLVGSNVLGGTIVDSYASGSVTGRAVVGGLVGYNDGSISSSVQGVPSTYATGTVVSTSNNVSGANTSNDDDAGGLVGLNDVNGHIADAYATGSVTDLFTGTGYWSNVGGLVGWNAGSIARSHASGATQGTAEVGGLVGVNWGGTIDQSYATGAVHALIDSGGGLVGYAASPSSRSQITNSYATGAVTVATNTAGGLVGMNGGDISNSYATGAVNSQTNVGGLIGYNDNTGSSTGNVQTSYATGSVVGTNEVGGLVGFNLASVEDSYATGSVHGQYEVGGLVGRNNGSISGTALIDLTYTTYASGHVVGGSGQYTGGLVGQNTGSIDHTMATGVVTGGTEQNTGGLVGSNYYTGSISYSFATGAVSGAIQHTGGLVGWTGGTVDHSYATGSVTGDNKVGGLAGINGGTITNSYATGSVSGHDAIGGLIGGNWEDTHPRTIEDSYATGSVSGNNMVGGLVGWNKGTITYDYATGNVNGHGSVGGLVGYNERVIDESYATGNVTSTAVSGMDGSYAGGLVGSQGYQPHVANLPLIDGNYIATIKNSYSLGNVSGTKYVGGFIGLNYYGGLIENSYARSAATSGSMDLADFVGQNDGVINNSFANNLHGNFYGENIGGQPFTGEGYTFNFSQTNTGLLTANQIKQHSNFSGWDFNNVWVIYDSFTSPLLRHFLTPITVTASGGSTNYNRVAYAGGNGVSYSATPNSNLLGSLSYSGSSQGAIDAGTYSIMPSGLYSNQQGYLINFVSGNLVINPATLTVSNTSVADKVYDGSRIATLSGGSLVGVYSGDQVTLAQAGTFATSNVGNNIPVTAADTISGTSAGNYTLTQPTGLTASITAPSGVSSTVANSISTTLSSQTNIIIGGITSVTTSSLIQTSVNGVGTLANITSAINTSVQVSQANLVPTASSISYSLVQSTTILVSIAPQPVIVSGLVNVSALSGFSFGSSSVTNITTSSSFFALSQSTAFATTLMSPSFMVSQLTSVNIFFGGSFGSSPYIAGCPNCM